ncbi:MAG: hypothetical protein HZB72_12420 [Burkholderiales bacterium]|nr:hypothetical protein [Burkholderiales bacterium]
MSRPGPSTPTQRGGARPAAPASLHSLDRARIERALRRRQRYRYVRPQVRPDGRGFRIVSPCCSRNVDPDGGLIDIARLLPRGTASKGVSPNMPLPAQPTWQLLRRDHEHGRWVLHSQADRLEPLLQQLCLDPQRVFWP